MKHCYVNVSRNASVFQWPLEPTLSLCIIMKHRECQLFNITKTGAVSPNFRDGTIIQVGLVSMVVNYENNMIDYVLTAMIRCFQSRFRFVHHNQPHRSILPATLSSLPSSREIITRALPGETVSCQSLIAWLQGTTSYLTLTLCCMIWRISGLAGKIHIHNKCQYFFFGLFHCVDFLPWRGFHQYP